MSHSALFTPIKVGAADLKHRIVMAPLTRMRAGQPDNIPRELNAEYYAQRATPGGLLIAEASQVVPSGQGYPATPGIYSAEQIEGWRKVTSAVHAKGGAIFLQLWHVGRISHSSFQPGGTLPVAPSPVPAAGNHFNAAWGQVPFEAPRALETAEIADLVQSYRTGARNARAAGFDGVELHGANGYLIEQFLQSHTNLRTDEYGGSIANRSRLLLEVTAALIEEVGAERVGVRLSPFGTTNNSGEQDPVPLYSHAISSLAELGPAYLHLIEGRANLGPKPDGSPADTRSASEFFRPLWAGALIAAGGYDPALAEGAVREGHADAIAFGRPFISNPDLVDRIAAGADLNPWDSPTFYGGADRKSTRLNSSH